MADAAAAMLVFVPACGGVDDRGDPGSTRRDAGEQPSDGGGHERVERCELGVDTVCACLATDVPCELEVADELLANCVAGPAGRWVGCYADFASDGEVDCAAAMSACLPR